MLCSICFQAEDGIRDLVRSRGLGDVYKRQLKPWPISVADRSIKGGFGVMFDDLLAAGYAIAAIQLLRPLLQSLI